MTSHAVCTGVQPYLSCLSQEATSIERSRERLFSQPRWTHGLYFFPSPVRCPGTDRPDAPAQGLGTRMHPGIERRSKWFESPDAAFLPVNIVAGNADKIMLRYVVFGFWLPGMIPVLPLFGLTRGSCREMCS